MTAHTPGPWTVDGNDIRAEHGEDEHELIACAYGFYTDWPKCEHTPETFANARLIAAAPDLLAACKLQHQAIDTLFALLIGADIGFMPTKSGAWEAILAGNAAIEKAVQQ